MARQKDVDWSDWKGTAVKPEHPMSRPLNPKLKKGIDVAAEALMTGHIPELLGSPPKQPTNEQLFGHLVVSEEMAKAKELKWENTIKDTFNEARKPIDHLNKTDVDIEWGYGTSFNQILKGQISDEEMTERNMSVSDR